MFICSPKLFYFCGSLRMIKADRTRTFLKPGDFNSSVEAFPALSRVLPFGIHKLAEVFYTYTKK